ncbi:MAG: histidinol-phosphate transaminase [Clostridia bacterium]|nr:histidinol-phosphate transaminase [Clostridia bacterium]MBO7169996.1 histidinol-phosphate transaminase [Clostridia bacterium]
MSRFLSKEYAPLKEYVPGEQPRDRRYIKLNTNESPYPPSPAVLAAVGAEAAEKLCLYSDPESKDLKEALAALYGYKKENVFVSNGSDDILNFAFMAFGKANGVVFPDISYGFYSVFANLHGLDTKVIPLREDFTVDVDAYCNVGRMVVLANPNAPTGIALPLAEIEKIVSSNPDQLVLIDEAYVDFGAESAMSLTEKYDNLLVVQTFSKSRSMAGARLGYAFASEEIIKDLEKIKYSTNPYNVNRITQAAGVAALSEQPYYDANCRRIMETREFAREALIKMGFTVTPSATNFLFAKHERVSGEEIYLRLKENGVLVRHFNAPRIGDFNRITVGTREEMETMLAALKSILERSDL